MITAIEVLAFFILLCIACAIVAVVIIWLVELVDELFAGRKRGQW